MNSNQFSSIQLQDHFKDGKLNLRDSINSYLSYISSADPQSDQQSKFDQLAINESNTILTAENYVSNERDDISLKDTLVNIYTLQQEFVCKRPTTPKKDLLEGYKHKADFMKAVSSFVDSAKQAINEGIQKRACAKWQSQLEIDSPAQPPKIMTKTLLRLRLLR